MDSFLSVQSLSKQIGQRLAVSDVSFECSRFGKMAIVGETGSGKSTLMKMIGGLVQPDTGAVYYEGIRVLGPNERLIPGHPKIGYLSQYFELRNNYRVHELMEMVNQLPEERAGQIYEVCQVDHLLQRWTHELSGGEKQRISLAKLLTTSPGLLLLDEPFSNFDLPHKRTMQQVIKDVGAELSISVLLVSHDAQDVLSWADTLLVLQEGRVIQQGAVQEVYRRPVNHYAAALLGQMQLLSSCVVAAITGSNAEALPEQLLMRPEWIQLSTEHGAAATVQQVNFCGNYYLLLVQCAGAEVYVQVQKNPPLPGDNVLLTADAADVWYW